MARLTQLSVLLTMLKAAVGRSTTVGTGDDVILYQLLSDKQKWLSCEYDWPFLEDRFDVAVPPLSRYLAFPTIDNEMVTSAMNLERPYKAEVFWNNLWSEVKYGIGSTEFNYLNSDQPGQIQDPVQRWRWCEEGQFEIWPINSTGQALRFTGQRALDTLVAPTDTADLDDQLIVLAVAAELLARAKQKDAELKQQLFAERLTRIRASYPTRSRKVIFGRCNDNEERKRLVPIAVHGN
jgi:hypothetical protein